jgi:hypothetical protein
LHESGIDSLIDYLDDVVPTGDEPRDGRTLELMRRYIRTSGRFGGGLLVRQDAGVGVDTAFRLIVDVDTAI